MTILFLGDSITEGIGASTYEKSYVPLIGNILKADIINYGISGTRIARQYFNTNVFCHFNYDMVTRLDIMDKNADVVVFFGGTNDFGHGCAPLGDKNSSDVFTFNGAVNVLLTKLVKIYTKDKLMIILPLPRHNENNIEGDGKQFKQGAKGTLKTYSNIIKNKANKLGLYVVDYRLEFTIDGKLNNALFVDGLHPNDNGHKLLAELISKDIEKLINKKR